MQNKSSIMKVAVYSGSFNPLHIGHLAILKYLAEETDFGQIRLVVSPVNPFKEGLRQTSADERFDAARAAVARHFPFGNVIVDDIELKMPAPHYSIRTLDAMKAAEADNEYTIVIGADNLAAFGRWREYRRILLEYGIAVYPRKGYDMEKCASDLLAENHSYRIRLIPAPQVDISSTQIRDAIDRGLDVSKWLM